jgi:hypothetical protein
MTLYLSSVAPRVQICADGWHRIPPQIEACGGCCEGITLSAELIEGIDRYERNRSRFITKAVQHELVRRRREELLRSLKSPHPEAAELAETGLAEWGARLPSDDEDLVDVSAGKAVRWIEGKGWVEESA